MVQLTRHLPSPAAGGRTATVNQSSIPNLQQRLQLVSPQLLVLTPVLSLYQEEAIITTAIPMWPLILRLPKPPLPLPSMPRPRLMAQPTQHLPSPAAGGRTATVNQSSIPNLQQRLQLVSPQLLVLTPVLSLYQEEAIITTAIPMWPLILRLPKPPLPLPPLPRQRLTATTTRL